MMRLSSSSDIPVSFGWISSAAASAGRRDMAAVRATAAELFANTSEKNSARLVVVAVIRALPLLFLLLIENADTRQLLVATKTMMSNNEKASAELIFSYVGFQKKDTCILWRNCSSLLARSKMTQIALMNQWVMSQKFECILSASNILALQVRRPPLIFRGLIGSSSEHKIGGNTAKLVSDTLNCARQK